MEVVESANVSEMEIVDENESNIDEFQKQFDQLDLSDKEANVKLGDFLNLLNNPRTDEQATKIKEQCVYR
jgi:hypothetical protein